MTKISTKELLTPHILAVKDFPQKGIVFRDITPLLGNAKALQIATTALCDFAPSQTTAVAGIEARGFIFAAIIAHKLQLPLVPLRKPNKLPRTVLSASYQLEYGSDAVEMHADALDQHAQVFLVDDVIATGGTLNAAAQVIEQSGATVAQTACLIELPDLAGKEKYARPLQSILQY